MSSLARLIGRSIRWLAPYVRSMLRGAVILITTSLSSMWIGVPTAINRIADDWTERATTAGIPSEYESEIVFVATVAATMTILLGWIVLAIFTAIFLLIVF